MVNPIEKILDDYQEDLVDFMLGDSPGSKFLKEVKKLIVTLIPDKPDVSIGQAVALAEGLKRRGMIQVHALRTDINGLDLALYNADADVVRDHDGPDLYRTTILAPFLAMGLKVLEQKRSKPLSPPRQEPEPEKPPIEVIKE